jgi:hypothetical protein
MTYLLAFLAYLLYIAMKAMQQRQVQHAEYLKMPPLSYGMAFCEVFVMSLVVKHADSNWQLLGLALAIGTGSSLGSILGTYLHARKHP